ncbi:MAG: thiamine phosphate synthase [Candidatus Saccharibacteria bacterium]|nr:thiamine phosphate synthase [Moraxellaceae bacterium]
MTTKHSLQGLYLITNEDDFVVLRPKLETAMKAGIALLQYRRKKTPKSHQEQEARDILELCNQYHVPFIINDDLVLAEKLSCGLHLGQGDGSLIEARDRLGADAIIGRTCHDSLELAKQAADEGASYLAFGAVFPSTTKPNARLVSLETLAAASQQFELPICAIGGLTPENSERVKATGVSLFAVVSDILDLSISATPARIKLWQNSISPCIT